MFPIRDTIPSRTPPLMTWAIIGANVFVFLVQWSLPESQLEELVYLFGVVPRRYTHPAWAEWIGFAADDYWPFITSMFLHGGLLHIVSNMWMLWIFGDNVEERMGQARFLVFYLLCGVAAGVTHVAANPASTVPVIGASGAIAGVLAAYMLLYPLARVICLVPVFIFPVFIEVHAFLFMGLWVLLQFFAGTLSLLGPEEQGGGVAWWAHLGGFGAGLILHRFFLSRRRTPRPLYQDEYGIEGAWRRR